MDFIRSVGFAGGSLAHTTSNADSAATSDHPTANRISNPSSFSSSSSYVSASAAASSLAGLSTSVRPLHATPHHTQHIEQLITKRLNEAQNRDQVRSRVINELRVMIAAECRVLSEEMASQLLLGVYNRCLQLVAHPQPHLSNAPTANLHVQRGALELMDSLLDNVGASNETILIRLANSLRQLLQGATTETPILHGAATALGHLARLSSPLTVDLVNFQCKSAFEWIQHEENLPVPNETRLLAAVLVLKELAANAPTLFNVYVPLFLEVIWLPIRSVRVDVRESATLALRVCLLDIATRAERWRKQCYIKIFTHAQLGLQTDEEAKASKSKYQPDHSASSSSSGSSSSSAASTPTHSPRRSPPTRSRKPSPPPSSSPPSQYVRPRALESAAESSARIHGSLLTLGELLEHANFDFMSPRFDVVMQLVVRYKLHSSKLIRKTIMVLLPRAARLDSESFKEEYLDETIKYIEQHMESEQRDTAFLSLGRLSVSMGPAIVPSLPPLLRHVSSSLALTVGLLPDTSPPTTSNKSSTSFFGFVRKTNDVNSHDALAETRRRHLRYTNTAMSCVGLLASSLHEQFQPHAESLLDIMFQTGLSQPLVDCLATMAKHLPSMQSVIEDRLLELISVLLQQLVTISSRDATITLPSASSSNNSFYSFAFKGSTRSSSASHQQRIPVYGSPPPKSLLATLPNGRVPVTFLPPSSRLNSISTPQEVRDHETNTIILALRTLASFQFSTQEVMLLAVAREILTPLLKEQEEEIRIEVARAITFIIPRLALTFLHLPAFLHVFDLLKAVLILSVSDRSSQIRFTILSSFLSSQQFVPNSFLLTSDTNAAAASSSVMLLSDQQSVVASLLVNPESLASLSLGLHDESFPIRDRVLALLASLAPRNPMAILPILRTFLIQLIQNLHHQSMMSCGAEDRSADYSLGAPLQPPSEQNAQLLLTLISYPGGEKLCRHYAQSILHVLLPKLTHALSFHVHHTVRSDSTHSTSQCDGSTNSSQFISCMLSTLGKLSVLAGADMRSSISVLLQLIVTTLQEQASMVSLEDNEVLLKRTVAIRTLGQLITSTGDVIEPYIKWPYLLPTLLRLMRFDSVRGNEPIGQRLAADGIDTNDSTGGSNTTSSLRSLSSALASQSTSHREFRLELLKLVGRIGTLNPDRFKSSPIFALLPKPTTSFVADPANVPAVGQSSESFLTAEPLLADLLTEYQESEEAVDPKTILHETYFPTVALRALAQILINPRLTHYHSLVLRAMLFIFRSLGIQQSAHFLPSTIPIILAEMSQLATQSSTTNLRPAPELLRTPSKISANPANSPHAIEHLQINYIQHLIGIIQIVGMHIRPYLSQLFFIIFGDSFLPASSEIVSGGVDPSLMVPYWRDPALVPSLLKLIEVVSLSLKSSGVDEEFRASLMPTILTKFIDLIHQAEKQVGSNIAEYTFESSDVATHALLRRVMHTIQVLSSSMIGSLDEFLPLLLPCLLRTMERCVRVLQRILQDGTTHDHSDAAHTSHNEVDLTVSPSYHLAVSIVHTLIVLLQHHQAQSVSYASAIIHTLCRFLQSPHLSPSPLTESCFELLCILMSQQGFEYLVYFESLVNQSITQLVTAYGNTRFHTSRTQSISSDLSPSIMAVSTPKSGVNVKLSPILLPTEVQTQKKTLLQTLRDIGGSNEASTATTETPSSASSTPTHIASVPTPGIIDLSNIGASQQSSLISTRTLASSRNNLAKYQSMLTQLKGRVHQTIRKNDQIRSEESVDPVTPIDDTTYRSSSPPIDLASIDLFHAPLFQSFQSSLVRVASDVDLESFSLPSRTSSYADLAALDAQLDSGDISDGTSSPTATPSASNGPKKLHMSQQNLMRAWTATQRSTKDDWLVWMRGFSIELLKESPSPALRACSFLAQKYPTLSSTLFHAAFLACWSELTDAFQDDLCANLEFIFTKCTSAPAPTSTSSLTTAQSSMSLPQFSLTLHPPPSSVSTASSHTIPSSIVTSLLNLIEYMEHSEHTLPISIGLLSSLSQRCHAFATALHYTEAQFHQVSASTQLAVVDITPDTDPATKASIQAAESTIESLITINNKLNQKAAAEGILKLVANQQIQSQIQAHRRAQQQLQQQQFDQHRRLERKGSFHFGFFSNEPPIQPKVQLKPLWFEKLHRWQDALEAYERKQEEMMKSYMATIPLNENTNSAATITTLLDSSDLRGRPEFVDTLLGKMRCLRSLGEWDELASLAQGVWNTTEDPIVRRELCGLAASAAVNLRRWESLAPLLVYFNEDAALPTSSSARSRTAAASQVRHRFDANYYSAIYLIHRGRFSEARIYIDRAAEVLDPSISALLSESYARAYKSLLLVQRLVQLEEVMEFKSESATVTPGTITPRQRLFYHMWSQRMRGGLSVEGDDIVDGWNEQLAIEQLVNQSPHYANEYNLDAMLQFCEILREQSQDHGSGSSFIRPLTSSVSSSNPSLSRPHSPYLHRSERLLTNIMGFEPIELIQDLLPSTSTSDSRQILSLPSMSISSVRLSQLYETIRPRHKLPHLLFVLWKLLYEQGYRVEAITRLKEMVLMTGSESDVFSRIARESAIALNSAGSNSSHELTNQEIEKLKAMCYVKLGKWQCTMLESSWSRTSGRGGGGGSGGASSDASVNSRTPYSPQLNPSRSFTFAYPDPVLVRNSSTGSSTLPISRGDPASAKSLYEILEYYRIATVLDPSYAKAWHEWGMLNAKVCTTWKSVILPPSAFAPSSSSPGTPHSMSSAQSSVHPVLITHVVAAIRAFFRSINLQQTLQDILRVLALWFEYGGSEMDESPMPELNTTMMQGLLPLTSPSPPIESPSSVPSIAQAMQQGFQLISLDNLLAVIPQLLARIHVTAPRVRTLLFDLLERLGRQHPQALVYPLTVASKSPLACRHESASTILDSLSSHSRNLVTQGSMVSSELVRVAILWHEQWHEGIEEASGKWFGSSDFDGMMRVFERLQQTLPTAHTVAENTFIAMYGREADEAFSFLTKAAQLRRQQQNASSVHALKASTNDQDQKPSSSILIAKAWELYTNIWRRVVKQIESTRELELGDVSPKLLQCRELELAVPGTYRSGQPIVRIANFATLLRIIDSKQHPRRLSILGSDGVEYPFLLKGHEDLRQDERVMQLFGLINTLLVADHATSKSDHSIRRYEVIPLSPNTGLIEWCTHSDPLHTVIKRYRDQKNILLNLEQRLMLKIAPDFHMCTIMQRCEVFVYALGMTSGADLANTQWLHAPNSQTWLDRRECFTRSTAVMSMVGYVLGLGDRHTCNILIDRNSRCIHIDFGDLFEVSMHRDRFPERVPFRLTRMMVNAMEVAGIEGTYRHTCEQVMRVMRKHKNSIMAVLEAFSLDPLLNWRLLDPRKRTQPTSPSTPSSEKPKHNANSNAHSDNLLPPPVVLQPNRRNVQEQQADSKMTQPQPVSRNTNRSNADATSRNSTNDSTSGAGARPDTTKVPIGLSAVQEYDDESSAALPPSPVLTQRARRSHVDETLLGVTLGTARSLHAQSRMDHMNAQASAVMTRVEAKLRGTEFTSHQQSLLTPSSSLSASSSLAASPVVNSAPPTAHPASASVPSQVQRLIEEATSEVNLSQAYIGWCPFW